jgi:DNA polymerase elongation subunit (family B)
MLLDFEYRNSKLITSEINKKGEIELVYRNWKNPMKYEPCLPNDPNIHPKYTTWDKKPVRLTPTNRPSRFSVYEFLDRLPEEERNNLFEYQEPNMYFVDIETEILDTGFVEPIDATSQVLTIAIVRNDKVMVIGIKPLTKQEINKIKNQIETHFEKFDLKINFKYISFHDRENPEKEMMAYFFDTLVPKMPVITGWNFVSYDWTFLINRCRKLGLKPENSSFTKNLVEVFGTDYELPAHRLVIDYMEIYKKWDTSIKVKERNSLDWVSNKILGVKKVDYTDEIGITNLQDLYEKKFDRYVFYNAVDTILVQLIHQKQQYINIAFSIANLAKIRLCDFSQKQLNTTLVQTEGFLRNEFRNKKNIVLCKDYDNVDTDTIPGGYVKPPNRGMNEHVACFDFASLYPTTQTQFNIAPENFKGFVIEKNPSFADFDGVLNKIEEDDIICINGAVFSREESVTVNFLKETYASRKKHKKIMNNEYMIIAKEKDELKNLEKELAELENKL